MGVEGGLVRTKTELVFVRGGGVSGSGIVVLVFVSFLKRVIVFGF